MGFVVGALPILYLIVCWYQNWRTPHPNSHALDQVPDEVTVTGEYLGCIRTQVTLDSSHHINHHAHYSVSFTVPTASISSRELELRCHMSQVSGQWRMSTIGRNNTDPESIKRDTTNTHWPLDITIIHSLAILRQKYNIILWHNINFQLNLNKCPIYERVAIGWKYPCRTPLGCT